MEPTNLIVQATAAAMFVKVLVDIVKSSPLPSPSAILPILALVFGQAAALLQLLSGGGTLNTQSASTTALVGILATGFAMGVTALQSKASKVEERVEAALEAPAGTTKKEVDAAVFK